MTGVAMSTDGQITPEELTRLFKAKRYNEIEQARVDGRLAVLLGDEPPPDPNAQLTQDDVSRLYAARDYDAIEAARTDGRLSDLLGNGEPSNA